MRTFFAWSVLFCTIVACDAQALRCSGKLVKEGDSASKVLKACGEPDFVNQRTLYRSLGLASNFHRQRAQGLGVQAQVTEAVTIEYWEYDFGSSRLVREIVFENGRVANIRRRGYGG